MKYINMANTYVQLVWLRTKESMFSEAMLLIEYFSIFNNALYCVRIPIGTRLYNGKANRIKRYSAWTKLVLLPYT